MSTIILTHGMPDLVADRLSRFGEILVAPEATEKWLCEHGGAAVAIAARANAPITSRVIDAAPSLRVIGRSGVGVDNVDLDAATSRGIPVVITPNAGTDAVAEGAFAMMLALLKGLPELGTTVRDGRWDERDRVAIGDLEDTVLGIVGVGRIGARLAELARAVGIEVIGYDPYADTAEVELVSLEELLGRANVLSLHCALTPDTAGLVDRTFIGRCRPGTILLNTSRGGLVRSLADLETGLREGRLRGVGLDVFDQEPPPSDHPLFAAPNVVVSPHALSLSRRSSGRVFGDMAAGMAEVLAGGTPATVANPEVLNMPMHALNPRRKSQ